MRALHTILLASFCIGVVGGCSADTDTDSPAPAKTEAEKQQALRDSTFGDLAGAMESAEDVEELNRERKRQLDEAIDQ